MNFPELQYAPSWYHLSDPDYVFGAFFYGSLLLATISLVEYIFTGVLFSKANGVIISDAAAHVAFNNSSWFEVFCWIFMKRPPRSTCSERRVCKRAALALFLRIGVLVFDLVILGLSLPHEIEVYDEEVRSKICRLRIFNLL